MTSTTTSITTVNKKAAQWGVYVDVERNGVTMADAAKAHGYSGSGAAGAARDSIKKEIDAGNAIMVNGVTVHTPDGTGVSADTSAPVDRYAVADTIMDNGGTFLLSVDKLGDQALTLRTKANTLREEADRIDEMADLADTKQATMHDQLATFGFDWDKFEEALKPTTPDAS